MIKNNIRKIQHFKRLTYHALFIFAKNYYNYMNIDDMKYIHIYVLNNVDFYT